MRGLVRGLARECSRSQVPAVRRFLGLEGGWDGRLQRRRSQTRWPRAHNRSRTPSPQKGCENKGTPLACGSSQPPSQPLCWICLMKVSSPSIQSWLPGSGQTAVKRRSNIGQHLPNAGGAAKRWRSAAGEERGRAGANASRNPPGMAKQSGPWYRASAAALARRLLRGLRPRGARAREASCPGELSFWGASKGKGAGRGALEAFARLGQDAVLGGRMGEGCSRAGFGSPKRFPERRQNKGRDAPELRMRGAGPACGPPAGLEGGKGGGWKLRGRGDGTLV